MSEEMSVSSSSAVVTWKDGFEGGDARCDR